MQSPHFFGYGSLVNVATHIYRPFAPAQCKGWRRVWRHTPARDLAYLSVQQDDGCQIDGLIAAVPDANWAVLDLREGGYSRSVVEPQSITHQADVGSVHIYHVTDFDTPAPQQKSSILLSYLDVVVTGYLSVFGIGGVDDFFATTDGWDAPILNDRSKPIYPRHVETTAEQRALVDDHLRNLSAVVKEL